MMHLFIGGIRDGDWFDVPKDRSQWVVRERPKPRPAVTSLRGAFEVSYHKTMCYTRMSFRGDKDKYYLFVAPHLSPDRVLSRLIVGYSGTGEDCE